MIRNNIIDNSKGLAKSLFREGTFADEPGLVFQIIPESSLEATGIIKYLLLVFYFILSAFIIWFIFFFVI